MGSLKKFLNESLEELLKKPKEETTKSISEKRAAESISKFSLSEGIL